MKLFQSLAFGLRSGISYLASYLWSSWAPAIAKIQLNVALGTGPQMRREQARGKYQWFSITNSLWAVFIWHYAVDTLDPDLGVGCGLPHTGAPN